MSEKVGLKSHEKVDFHKEIAIIGGGPAGALAGYLLAKKGFTNVTIYDTGQFKIEQKIEKCPGCAGIIQPKVVQFLEKHGLVIPEDIIQNRLSKESLIHLPGNTNLPIQNERGGAITVYRRPAPVKQPNDIPRTKSFDGWLLDEATKAGASYKRFLVKEIDLRRKKNINKKVTLTIDNGEVIEADFVIGAYGHNALKEDGINILYPEGTAHLDKPTASISAVREIFIGREGVAKLLQNKMHLFGNPTEKIWYAMVVPKDNHVTVSIMGRGDNSEKEMNDIMKDFLQSDSIRNLLSDVSKQVRCGCTSTYTTKSPENYIAQDEDGNLSMVNIGDAGPTRPMKNGIGAAMDSAEKLVGALSQYGFGRETSEIYNNYIDQDYILDNYWADFILKMTDQILARQALLKPTRFILTHHLWPFKKPINDIINLIISGEKPYWQIPLAQITEKLFH